MEHVKKLFNLRGDVNLQVSWVGWVVAVRRVVEWVASTGWSLQSHAWSDVKASSDERSSTSTPIGTDRYYHQKKPSFQISFIKPQLNWIAIQNFRQCTAKLLTVQLYSSLQFWSVLFAFCLMGKPNQCPLLELLLPLAVLSVCLGQSRTHWRAFWAKMASLC